MSNSELFGLRSLRTAATSLAVALAATACSFDTDDTLGSNIVPENQQMKAGYLALESLHPRKYVETRLYQTDSIVSSNISYGYFGSMVHEKLGRRTAGFLTQYTNYYTVDSGYFGFRPFLDSVQLHLSIADYGGDTTVVQQFAVYEVTSSDYLKLSEDTTFYLRFDPVEAGTFDPAAEPLFTFSLGGERGPATTAVTLTPTEAGRAFVRRIFLEEGPHKHDYSIYSRDSIPQWLDAFKGLYIRPLGEPAEKGAIYVAQLDAGALSIYGRNRRKEDPALIRDTIGVYFNFIDPFGDNSNVSVNTIRHDYAQGSLGLRVEEVNEAVQERPERSQLIVEGLGGVLSELTFTQAFFDELEKVLADEKAATKKEFSTLAFSQAMIYFYFPSSCYDYLSLTPAELGDERYRALLDEMDGAQSRLGLYTSYKKLTPVSDYAYSYEQSYGTTLDYGGYVNRSHGRYGMNITGCVQKLWNSYRKERDAAKAEGRAVDLGKVEGRTIYLGPEAYGAYSFDASFLQGSNNDAEPALTAPIRFELTYNMIK